jgi:hypothetical protein
MPATASKSKTKTQAKPKTALEAGNTAKADVARRASANGRTSAGSANGKLPAGSANGKGPSAGRSSRGAEPAGGGGRTAPARPGATPAANRAPAQPAERHQNEGHGRRLTMAFEALEAYPALAESRARLLSVMAKDHVATADVVTAVESDVAMIIAVLRLANQVQGGRGRRSASSIATG